MAVPNTLFAVLNVADPVSVEERLSKLSPWISLKLTDGQWLLIAPSTTTSKEVSDKLGFDQSNGLVVRVDTYFGRGPRSTWEWITTKQGLDLGTTAN